MRRCTTRPTRTRNGAASRRPEFGQRRCGELPDAWRTTRHPNDQPNADTILNADGPAEPTLPGLAGPRRSGSRLRRAFYRHHAGTFHQGLRLTPNDTLGVRGIGALPGSGDGVCDGRSIARVGPLRS